MFGWLKSRLKKGFASMMLFIVVMIIITIAVITIIYFLTGKIMDWQLPLPANP